MRVVNSKVIGFLLLFSILCNEAIEQNDIFLENKIIGGTPILLGDAAYQALVAIKTNETEYSLVCGGAIVNSKYILTAAQCLLKNIITNVEYYTVEDLGVAAGNNKLGDIRLLKIVERFIIHPEFNVIGFLNDIALLKIQGVFIPSPDLQFSIFSTTSPAVGSYCRITGWGLNNITFPEVSQELLGLRVMVISNHECENEFNSIMQNSKITDKKYCAISNVTTNGPCLGDAGGPLLCNRTIAGIASFVYSCALAVPQPAVYIDIASYRDWIRDESSASTNTYSSILLSIFIVVFTYK